MKQNNQKNAKKKQFYAGKARLSSSNNKNYYSYVITFCLVHVSRCLFPSDVFTIQIIVGFVFA